MKLKSRKPKNRESINGVPLNPKPVNQKRTSIQGIKSMQWIYIFIFIFFLSHGAGSFLQAQTKQEKREQKEKAIMEWIDNGHFTVSVDRALPMGGRSVPLTTLYSLELRRDSVFSYLPYFGRAYTAPYGGRNSMDFAEPLTDYVCTYTKKGAVVIQFKAKTNDDNFTFRLQIYPNGSTTIQVTPVNRQSITYYGEIVSQKKSIEKESVTREKDSTQPENAGRKKE